MKLFAFLTTPLAQKILSLCRPAWNFADAGLEETDELFGKPFVAYYDSASTLDAALDRGMARIASAFVWAATGQWQLSSSQQIRESRLPAQKSWLQLLSREAINRNAVILS